MKALIVLVFFILFFLILKDYRKGWYLFFLLFPLWVSRDVRISYRAFTITPSLFFLVPISISYIFSFFVGKRRFTKPFNLEFIVLFYIALLATGFYGYIQPGEPGFTRLIKITFGFALYFLLSVGINGTGDLMKMLKILLFSSLVLTGYLLFTNFFIHHRVVLGGNFWMPDSRGKNQLAIFLAILIPISLSYWIHNKSVLGSLSVLAFSTALICTNSRGSLIAAVVGSLVLFIMSEKKRNYLITFLVLTLSLTLFVIFIYPEPHRISNRLLSIIRFQETQPGYYSIYFRKLYAILSFDAFVNHPLGGLGLGKLTDLLFFRSPHNDYLWVLSEGGLLVFLPFVMFLSQFVRKSFQLLSSKKNSPDRWIFEGIAGSLISILILFLSMDVHETLPVWFIFGCAAILSKRSKNENACLP